MRRVTLLDVANESGCSKATVSMALRDFPEISKATKKRVAAAAQKLGYRPDPALARIAAARWNDRKASEGSVLAFLSFLHPDQEGTVPEEVLRNPKLFIKRPDEVTDWHYTLPSQTTYLSAQEQARELGYELEFFFVTASTDIVKLSSILYNRGIQGVIWSPNYKKSFIKDFTWDRFATVAFGDHYYPPPTDNVVPDLAATVLTCWKKLYEYGYRRPGLVLYRERFSHLTSLTQRGLFLSIAEAFGTNESTIPAAYISPGNKHDLRVWLSVNRPDVVVGFSDYVWWALKDLNITVPDDVAFVSLSSPQISTQIAGCLSSSHAVGKVCVNIVDRHLRNGQVGRSHFRSFHTVPEAWKEGESLPDLRSSADKLEAAELPNFLELVE